MLFRLIILIAAIAAVREAAAADAEVYYRAPPAPALPAPPLPWSWTGFYGGLRIGGAAGTAKFADPFGSSTYGDNVATPGFLAGGQIGYNWQVANSNWVLGAEADANWLTSDGTNTCLAFSGLYVSANCRAQPNMISDLTARVGWAYGRFDHSLIYLKGGAAVVHDQVSVTTNATPGFGLAPLATSSSFTEVGWTAGAGVEHAITPAWSVKIEYDYVGLGPETVATPRGLVQHVPGANAFFFTPAGTTHVSQSFQEANLSLNYKFGMDPLARWAAAPPAFPIEPPFIAVAPGWEFEGGARYWYSSGKFQKDLGSTTNQASANILNSRLTYDTAANSGELFGRIEAPQNVFVKGIVGIGSLANGTLNDEDWAPVLGGKAIPYSNTSSSVAGNIDYATADLGYDFFRGIGYRLGAFAGYNYYKENKSGYGCTQIANPLSDCVPAIANSVLVITEDDTWQSLRVGVNGQIMVANRLKLEADVAYLPYAQFTGTDDHVLRAFSSAESGTGEGLQLEGILSYLITDQFSAGLGGRYWAMWTTNAITEFAGAPCPCQTQPAKTDRYGVFLQLDYKLAGSPS